MRASTQSECLTMTIGLSLDDAALEALDGHLHDSADDLEALERARVAVRRALTGRTMSHRDGRRRNVPTDRNPAGRRFRLGDAKAAATHEGEDCWPPNG
jgi:hypothetical protein